MSCNQFQDWIDPDFQFSTTASSPRWARPDRLIVPVINRQTCWQVSTRFHFNFKQFQFQQGRLETRVCSKILKLFHPGPLLFCLHASCCMGWVKIKHVGPPTPVKELLVVANKKLISKYWSEKISFVYYCLRSLISYKQKKSILFLWIWWEFSSVTSWIDWTNLILYWNSKNFQVLEWNWMLNAKWCDTFSIIKVALRHKDGLLTLNHAGKANPLVRKGPAYFTFSRNLLKFRH